MLYVTTGGWFYVSLGFPRVETIRDLRDGVIASVGRLLVRVPRGAWELIATIPIFHIVPLLW